MKTRNKYIILSFGLILTGLVAFSIYPYVFFKPFDFGPCNGNGKPNRYEKMFYDNGQLEIEGQIINCAWHGLLKTYYETGELKSGEQRFEGKNHGTSKYFHLNGNINREEEYQKGELIKFKIYPPDLTLHYEFSISDRVLSVSDSINKSQIIFSDSLFFGQERPLVMLNGDDLILRAEKDFYLINSKLEVIIDLRDTLMKYIPFAYSKKVDNNGNIHDFTWRRRIENDSLHLRVFYKEIDHPSITKIWKRKYKLE